MISLWDQILSNTAAGISDPVGSLAAKRAKVVQLGKSVSPISTAFPLEYLVELFERTCYEQRDRLEHGWVTSMLRQTGLAHRSIFLALDGLVQSKASLWQGSDGQYFLLSDLFFTLQLWLSEESGLDFPLQLVDHRVSAYLGLLAKTRPTDALFNRFSLLQQRLRARL